MHVVQMPKKPELKLLIPAPRVRLRPRLARGGKHHNKRRRPRSTERVLLKRDCDS